MVPLADPDCLEGLTETLRCLEAAVVLGVLLIPRDIGAFQGGPCVYVSSCHV